MRKFLVFIFLKSLSVLSAIIVLNFKTFAGELPPIRTVFVIVLENHNWLEIKDSPIAPFINQTLLPLSSYCEQYFNPPKLHPSEPNYIWLQAGTNFGITNDGNPSSNHQNTTNHLTDQLDFAGISWKSYQEDISGMIVPLTSTDNYVPRHDPFVFFDDITGTNDPNYIYGIAHIRPYEELAGDLTNNSVARYNFITPNLCDDGHSSCAPQHNSIQQIDDWLASEIPKILDSAAYSNNGAIFITWDEGEGIEGDTVSDGPIGMMILSPLARGGGYFNNIHYTHSSCLRTIQEIFNLSPWLGDAANATDLSDLFGPITIKSLQHDGSGLVSLNITGVVPGRTNYVETSTNLVLWNIISTNSSSSNSFSFIDMNATNCGQRFYRVREAQ
jgi:phosphatidylinositol-3-phosphatase